MPEISSKQSCRATKATPSTKQTTLEGRRLPVCLWQKRLYCGHRLLSSVSRGQEAAHHKSRGSGDIYESHILLIWCTNWDIHRQWYTVCQYHIQTLCWRMEFRTHSNKPTLSAVKLKGWCIRQRTVELITARACLCTSQHHWNVVCNLHNSSWDVDYIKSTYPRGPAENEGGRDD